MGGDIEVDKTNGDRGLSGDICGGVWLSGGVAGG